MSHAPAVISKGMIGVSEAAKILDRSQSGVRNYVATGKLKANKASDGHLEITRASLAALAKELKPRDQHSQQRGPARKPVLASSGTTTPQNRYYGGEKTAAAKAVILETIGTEPIRQRACTDVAVSKLGVSEITARYALKALVNEQRVVQVVNERGNRQHAEVLYRLAGPVKRASNQHTAPAIVVAANQQHFVSEPEVKRSGSSHRVYRPQQTSSDRRKTAAELALEKVMSASTGGAVAPVESRVLQPLPVNGVIRRRALAAVPPVQSVVVDPPIAAQAGRDGKILPFKTPLRDFPRGSVITADIEGVKCEYVELSAAMAALEKVRTEAFDAARRVVQLEGQAKALEEKLANGVISKLDIGPLAVHKMVVECGETTSAVLHTDGFNPLLIKKGDTISIVINAK